MQKYFKGAVQKAFGPRYVMEAGIVTATTPDASKAESPMYSMESGISTPLMWWHHRKAMEPMCVTPLGISTVLNKSES
jgi:hypothetical protein